MKRQIDPKGRPPSSLAWGTGPPGKNAGFAGGLAQSVRPTGSPPVRAPPPPLSTQGVGRGEGTRGLLRRSTHCALTFTARGKRVQVNITMFLDAEIGWEREQGDLYPSVPHIVSVYAVVPA